MMKRLNAIKPVTMKRAVADRLSHVLTDRIGLYNSHVTKTTSNLNIRLNGKTCIGLIVCILRRFIINGIIRPTLTRKCLLPGNEMPCSKDYIGGV